MESENVTFKDKTNKFSKVDKPNDWPQNGRELKLEKIFDAFQKFINEYSLENKEFLLSLVTNNDLNEENPFGICRFTKYEVAVINEIYTLATFTQCSQVKLWIYEFLIDTVILKKTTEMMMEGKTFEETFHNGPYLSLIPQLKVFYIAYVYFRVEKDKSFLQQLLLRIKSYKKAAPSKKLLSEYIQAINQLIYDLSFNINSQKLGICRFSKIELKQLFEVIINIWNTYEIDPTQRPLRGVFIITISNFVLKARNENSSLLLYKCLPNSAATCTFSNKQVWMKNINSLNDKREGISFKNLFDRRNWINKEWAKKTVLIDCITKYVCSFTRITPSEKMKNKYGHSVYGYKNDRIGNLISPVYNDFKIPQFSLVMGYDIAYDHKTIEDEVNYIIDVIDSIKISDNKKRDLLSSILSYWDLSVKDKKWSYECERRYEIRIFNHEFIDSNFDSTFLKVKSTLYLLPDFISKDNLMFEKIKKERIAKLSAIAQRNYVFCSDCLQADFDNLNNDTCMVCGSKNIVKCGRE